MWEIEKKYLQDDETIEFTDRPSKLSCILSYIWGGLMAFGVFMVLLISITSDEANGIGVMALLYFAMAMPAIIIILKRYSTYYAITNKGAIVRTGILTTSIKTVPFKHITSTEVFETIAGRVFRYAHVSIDTSGSGKGVELRWNFTKSAHKVKKIIDGKIHK